MSTRLRIGRSKTLDMGMAASFSPPIPIAV